MKLREQIGKIDAAGNYLSEVAYPVAVWLVLLWPLVLHPALDALARSANLQLPF